jgi:phosphoglycolate phosphatase-like HAD superfamily hydrolase
MVVLLDLDGTLTNTAHSSFKPFKDGISETNPFSIPVLNGAIEFVNNLKKSGHTPIILSDSHPQYVSPIAKQIFNVPALSLCDKPNSKKTVTYLQQLGYNLQSKDDFIVIGDTWLDIELGRSLNFRTILTQLYIANEVDERDGIGKTWSQLKSGPTYVVKQYSQILEILRNPLSYLLAAEAIFQNTRSVYSIKLNDLKTNDHITLFRSLGRQDVGECDRYGIAVYYTEFQREGRSNGTLLNLARAIQNFLTHVVNSAPQFKWDYITYVSDKSTTTPANKMRDFFELIQTNIPKLKMLEWVNDVDGSIRNRENYKARRDFIGQNLRVIQNQNLTGKSVIVIDDQFTSGGTAYEVTSMLRRHGAKNILFLTLFFMISAVSSNRNCSRCGKPMQLKIRKSDGNKFFSCTPPQYRGNGCGHIENIEQ